MSSLPPNYYLKRGSTDARRRDVDFDAYGEANLSNPTSSSMVQYSELSHTAQRIVSKGANNNSSRATAKSELLKLEILMSLNKKMLQQVMLHCTTGSSG